MSMGLTRDNEELYATGDKEEKEISVVVVHEIDNKIG
jgi:hypothetical protein